MAQYTVKLGMFSGVEADSPLEAAKTIANWILNDSFDYSYLVKNEETKECHSVDLSCDDEDAVLPLSEEDFKES